MINSDPQIYNTDDLETQNILKEQENFYEDIDYGVDKSGEIIDRKIGYIKKSYYDNLDNKEKSLGNITKNALNIAKTSQEILQNLGEKQGDQITANVDDYQINKNQEELKVTDTVEEG